MVNQPMDDFDESWLSAYLDNELSPDQRRHVETMLETQPDLRQTLDRLVRIRTAIAACKIELPSETRIVRSGPWDAPKSEASSDVDAPCNSSLASKGGWFLNVPTWLLSLAASILVIGSLSSLYWFPLGNGGHEMLATRMDTKSQAPSTAMQAPSSAKFGSANAATEEFRINERAADPENAPAGNAPMILSDSVSPPPASPMRSETVSSDFSLDFKTEASSSSRQDALSRRDSFFSYFLAAKESESLVGAESTEPTDLPALAKRREEWDFQWTSVDRAKDFGRSTPAMEDRVIVLFTPKTEVALSFASPAPETPLSEWSESVPNTSLGLDDATDVKTDKSMARGRSMSSAEGASKGREPNVLELRIPVAFWSEAAQSLRGKGFEIPEELPPGNYRFEPVVSQGSPEKPWAVQRLPGEPEVANEETPAYYTLTVILHKTDAK